MKSPLYKHKCPYFRNKLSKCSVFVNPVIFFKFSFVLKLSAAQKGASVDLLHSLSLQLVYFTRKGEISLPE